MKIIDRKQAEDFLKKFKVSCSELNQNNNEISILLKLSNGKKIVTKYNINKKNKSYYLK